MPSLRFEKILIADERFESAAVFDVDNDGVLDIVSGGYWYPGPRFDRKCKIADLEPVGDAPAPVRRLIERCLRKDPRNRLRDIGDARLSLEDLLTGRAEPSDAAPPTVRRLRGAALAIGGLILGAAVTGVILRNGTAPEASPETNAAARYSIALPGGPRAVQLDTASAMGPPIAISRDGRTVVFSALNSEGTSRLYIRREGDAMPTPLPGTDNAQHPFVSPDGKHVGFVNRGSDTPRRLSLADGTVTKIATASGVRGVAWDQSDRVIFSHFESPGLEHVAASGGDPVPLTEVADDERDHSWPYVLPNGTDLLFTASMRDGRFEPRVLTRATGEITRVRVNGKALGYLPGFLIYTRSEDVLAVRFDLASRKTIGEPARVLAGIHQELGTPFAAISPAGVLVYEPGRPPSPGAGLVWVDRAGKATPIAGDKMFEFPRLSADGKRVIAAIHTVTSNHDIWAFGTERKTAVKLTSDGNYIEPAWSLDNKSIVFSSAAGGNLLVHRLGDSRPKELLQRPGQQFALQWMRGDVLLFDELSLG